MSLSSFSPAAPVGVARVSHRPGARDVVKGVLAKVGLRRAPEVPGSWVAEAGISDGIGLHHYGISPDGYHPFVRAVRAGLASGGDPAPAIRAVLGAYYSRVTPANAAEWLDVPRLTAPPELLWAPPWAATMPWQARSPAEWRALRERGIRNENRLAGQELPIQEGWHSCGPVSERKAAIETRRLYRVLASLQENGLRRHGGRDGDIEVVLLRGGGVQRWFIDSGHHRATVASALGYETVPVRIRGVFDLRDVATWPQVVSGIYTAGEATRFVERLLEGGLPRVTRPWVRWVRTAGATRLGVLAS